MGWTLRAITIHYHVSSHNSDQDYIDQELAKDFWDRIDKIAREDKYGSIGLMVYGDPRVYEYTDEDDAGTES